MTTNEPIPCEECERLRARLSETESRATQRLVILTIVLALLVFNWVALDYERYKRRSLELQILYSVRQP